MTDQSISQRPAASTLKDDDLIPISQKQTNGRYLTCKVTADKLKGAKGDKGDRGTAGATGADGQSGSSAYDSWFNANSDIEKYLLSRKAIDVLSNSQIQTLMAQTGLSLGFDDYLNSKLLIELYEDISNGGSLTSHEFLNAAGLKTAYRSYLENYISASDYALVSSIVSDPNNSSEVQNIASLGPISQIPTIPLAIIYQFLQNQNPTLTVAHFATVDMPIINQLRLLDSPSTPVEAYVNNHTLLDMAVLKGLYMEDADYDLALNRYMNTYMANTVILAGLSTYNVNAVIQNWIDNNTEAWFKQLPLLKIARKWTEV